MPKKKKESDPKPSKSEPIAWAIPTEVLGGCLLVFVIFMSLSLASYTDGYPEVNWMGFLGYVVASICHYCFGAGTLLLIPFLSWIGWRVTFNKTLGAIGYKWFLFSCSMLSTCILLTVLSERYALGEQCGHWIYSEFADLTGPNHGQSLRYYLGGVPAYALYLDIPTYHLKYLLNDAGVTFIFGTLLTTTTLLLLKIKIHLNLPEWDFTWTKALSDEESGKSVDEPVKQVITIDAEEEPLPPYPPVESKEMFIRQVAQVSDPDQQEEPIAHTPEARSSAVEDDSPHVKRERALREQEVHNGDFTHYNLPQKGSLTKPKKVDQEALKKDLQQRAAVLEETLQSFGIDAKVGQINCGPSITSFEVHPSVGVKVQRIRALEHDIALNMEARTIRIIAPIPGKAAVGIEVPNASAQEVGFSELQATYEKAPGKYKVPVFLGKTVTGEHVISDLAKMPHCIIAGATGSGKSVCINAIIMSILMNAKPDEIKLMMIDPKKVELTPYTRLPHMITPVITEAPGACNALHWLVKEMERRYETLKNLGVRNIDSYRQCPEAEDPMPYIVCIIDELADLMMVASNDIETPIARIAQMARAVGIHMILATQRPSREVITGIIKANFPTRISFKVASRINSQIILDETGAESLLGNGDMLFLPPGSSNLTRAQGVFVRDEDIRKVVKEICEQSPPNYLIESFDEGGGGMDFTLDEEAPKDSLFERAMDIVIETGTASTTFLQRKLKVGYARAASIMDQLEEQGVVSAQDGSKGRKVLVSGRGGEQTDEMELEFDE